MKKFIFTPLWNVEKTEKILSDYEKDGYRLENFRFPYMFEFKESKPKDALYFITKFSKGNSNGQSSVNLEFQLTREYGCSPVSKFELFTGYNVYRTLKQNDFTEFKGMRADFFRKLYRDCLIVCIIFLVLFSVMFILSLHGNSGEKGNTFFITVIVFFILSTAYSLFGYLKERKVYNYYNKIYKEKKKASE